MWKVKRMNTSRIVVLTTAGGAGGIAAYLADQSGNKPLPTEPGTRLPTADVLVAKSGGGPDATARISGESILEPTLGKANAAGLMAAILPTGMRVSRPTTTQK